ncbi:MAG: hypothetical protein MI742_17390, partial [Desulfobacterales bacterium]|nr:hypothetical protein [Desulfobacterales bacterium]
MRIHVGVFLALLAVMAGISFCFAAPSGSKDQVILIDTMRAFRKLERSAVRFPHGRHTQAMRAEGCIACHTFAAQKSPEASAPLFSSSFKKSSASGPDDLKHLYHKECMGCHAKREKANQSSGPQICSGCHANGASEDLLSEAGFDLNRHASHAKKAELKCSQCHHLYDEKSQKRRYVKGEEGACIYCHAKDPSEGKGRKMPGSTLKNASHAQCLGCHFNRLEKKEASGPILCHQCHVERGAGSIAQVPDSLRLKRGQPDISVMGGERGDSNPKVVFNHKAHEQSGLSCKTCHHKAIASCQSCHTLKGDSKGGFINLEKAMHSKTREQSCMACHNRSKKGPQCAGCHEAIPAGALAESDGCANCHTLALNKGEALPQEKRLQKQVSRRLALPGFNLRRKAPETVTIDALTKTYAPSFFPHKKMVDALSAAAFENSLARVFHGSEEVLCQGCHHNAPASEKPAPCVRCHPASRSQKSDDRPDLMGAYHLQCMACHT